jgi:hypothetical protein
MTQPVCLRLIPCTAWIMVHLVPAACSCHLGKARVGPLISIALQGDTLGMRIQYGMWIVPPFSLHNIGASAQIQMSSRSRYDLQQQ